MDGKSQDDNRMIYMALKVYPQMKIAEGKEISVELTFQMDERKHQFFSCSSG